MPKGIPLTKEDIRHRMIEWRNLKHLYDIARKRISSLKDIVKNLKKKLGSIEEERNTWKQRTQELEEKLKQKEDANKKLRALLFEKQHGHIRIKRSHQSHPRSTSSYTRPTPKKITEHKELILKHCPECETPVSNPISSRTRIIEDIVFHPQAKATKWTLYRHWCTGCSKQVEGRIPGVLPKTRIGPSTLSFVLLAKYRWNQPYEKIQDQLKTCFGLHISQGEIAKLIKRSAALVGDKWEEILQAVKQGKIVHCDETGWYINGKKVWAHTFANEHVVLYEISSSRGKKIAENMLEGFTGTRITDCLPNYKNLSGNHQICWAHITREAQENSQREPDSKERIFLSQELDIIYKLLRRATKKDPFNRRYAKHIHTRCRTRLTKLLQQKWKDERCTRLLNRLVDFDHALFTCLVSSGIPPDNNHAERVLRKLVVQRKISGGNRSPDHSEYHAKNMSVIETLRLEKGDLLKNLQNILRDGVSAQLSGG